MSNSIRQGLTLAPTLYFMIVDSLGYLLYHRSPQGLIKGIPLLGSRIYQMGIQHFLVTLFLLSWEEKIQWKTPWNISKLLMRPHFLNFKRPKTIVTCYLRMTSLVG